jgi:benzoate/toluate 1,2-dioxygenase subunit beta
MDLVREVEQLLFAQGAALDEKRWGDFIELFTEDGVYWMPAQPEQTTWEGVPSIFAEDRSLMTVRMKRLTHPHAWSQAPLWGTSHLVGNIVAEERGGEIVARSRFHMMEFRRDASRHFAGSYLHHLRRTRSGLRVRLQRVDMVNAQQPYDYVLQAWV